MIANSVVSAMSIMYIRCESVLGHSLAMIARDWNVPRSGAGYVTRFQVLRSFLDRYEVHQVGGKTILEYWIPADDLPALNASIVGTIEVTAAYH